MDGKEKKNSKEDFGELEKEILSLRKQAEINIYRKLTSIWIKLAACVVIPYLSAIIIIVVIKILAPNFSFHLNLGVAIQSRDYQITSDVFIVTITIIGVVTGFVPIISFFANSDIKEDQRELEKEIDIQITASEGEEQKLIKAKKNLYYMVYHNLRSGLLKYTQLFIGVSVLTQVILVEIYLLTDIEPMIIAYPIIIIPILWTFVLGIIPIINFALNKPALRFVQVVVRPAETETRIEPEK